MYVNNIRINKAYIIYFFYFFYCLIRIYIYICINKQTKTNVMTKKELLKGEVFTFINENKFLEAEVSFGDTRCKNEFTIFFNGELIKIAKTFKAIENKIEQLKKDFNLEPIDLSKI